VAIYEYRCDEDGVFDVTRPLGTAPESVACPACGREARRVFSIPTIRCGSRPGWMAAIDHAEKSRHEPEVVTSVPAAGAPRRTRVLPLTPTLARLPRP
jgi:putative FmdB family regulatory protein